MNTIICLVQDIVLKNAESWAKLVRESVTPTAIKSSKESFQHFRKAAMEKEEREKALKKKLTEDKKEKEAPDVNSRYPHRNSKCITCIVRSVPQALSTVTLYTSACGQSSF